MTENCRFQTKRPTMRLTKKELEALSEAAYRWGLTMSGYEYDQRPLQSALEKIDGRLAWMDRVNV